jgi:hypothetical protein
MYAGSETKIGPQSHAGDIIIRFMFWKYLSWPAIFSLQGPYPQQSGLHNSTVSALCWVNSRDSSDRWFKGLTHEMFLRMWKEALLEEQWGTGSSCIGGLYVYSV